MTSTIESTISRMRAVRLLIVGDVMLDRFVTGNVLRISPEAPTPVISVVDEVEILGGAANAARNAASLGAAVTLIGTVGHDGAGSRVTALLDECGCSAQALVRDSTRPTTLKVRFVSPLHNTHLLRADWEDTSPIPADVQAKVQRQIELQLPGHDVVLLSDYGKGLLTDDLIRLTIELARNSGKQVVVDPKGSSYERYRGATAITPNLHEVGVALGKAVHQEDASVEIAARSLLEKTDSSWIIVKRGPYGSQLVSRTTSERYPSTAPKVVDVSGAGDTLTTAFALGLGVGSPGDALRIATAAAGIVVGKRGTATLSMEELQSFLIPRPHARPSNKFAPSPGELRERMNEWKRQGLTVGLANGCFDLLHPGHVHMLARAREKVDRLVVALNGDASVSRLKGPTRPIQNEEARTTVMAALECVDAVVLFHEDTPQALIEAVLPDVIFKGADYRLEDVVGRDVVERNGGRVELIDLVPDASSSRLIHKAAS